MTARRFCGDRLLVATHNPGKIREFQDLLGPRGITVESARERGLEEPDETGQTFVENARLKAHAAARSTNLPALADDSGLAASGLDGQPGVHSARWAGPERDFGRAMRRLRDALVATAGRFERADRRAAFVAVLCLAWPDGDDVIVEGRVEGTLVDPPRGLGGFGYDPMFVPAGHALTFAEMPAAAKASLSHRGRAVRALIERCFG